MVQVQQIASLGTICSLHCVGCCCWFCNVCWAGVCILPCSMPLARCSIHFNILQVEPGEPPSESRFLRHKELCRHLVPQWGNPVPSGAGVAMRDGQIIGVYRQQIEGVVVWQYDPSVDVIANEFWHSGVYVHQESRLR